MYVLSRCTRDNFIQFYPDVLCQWNRLVLIKDVLECFNYYAKRHALNKSQFTENCIKEWIEKNEPKAFKELNNKLKELDDFIKGLYKKVNKRRT